MHTHAAWIMAVADTAHEQGTGNLLRFVIVGSVAGVGLLAWIVLRGYGSND